MLLARADTTLETLHAIEPACHRFNLLVIAIGPGMFSPVVAVAALTSLACLNLLEWVVERREPASGSSDDSDQCVRHGTGQVIKASSPHMSHAIHPLPLVAIPMLLLVNTLYFVVLSSTSGFAWQACTVSVINWITLGISCWWMWERLSGSGGHHQSTTMSRGHVDAPIELTEMLLTPIDQHHAETAPTDSSL